VALTVAVLASAPGASAQDTLFVGGQFLDLSAGATGSAGSAEWLHAFSPERTLNVGVSSFSVAGTRWTYGRAGGTLKPIARVTVHAEAEMGSGTDPGGRFGYRTLRASAGYEAVARRLILEVEDQYVDVHETAGNVVKLGFTMRPAASVTVSAAVHGTTSGSVDTRTLMARAAYDRGGATVFAGLSAGRSRPALVNLGTFGPAQRLREIFGGLQVPVGRLQLTLAFDRLVLGQASRQSLTMSWKVPL
jgi:hypothetical protein